MKRMIAYQFVLLTVFALCVGCSSVKPAPGQNMTAVVSPPQEEPPPPHDYPMKWFVDGWLLGKAPPPDFPEPGNEGSEAWAWLGVILQDLGQSLCK